MLAVGATLELVGARWGSGWWGLALLVGGYFVLLVFAVLNARLAGMVLVAAGLLANLVVVGLDSGMPVRGIPAGVSFGVLHHGAGPGDRLAGLGDVLHIGFIRETVSAGDVLLAVGVATAVACLTLSKRRTSAA